MHIRRNTNLMVEPPSVATGDIAFNLLIFFLVCASSQPEGGRRQDIPRSEKQAQQQESKKNVEVSLTRTTVSIGDEGTSLVATNLEDFPIRLRRLLAGRGKPEERIVVVRSTKDTPYRRWIEVTGLIEQAGGTITLQMSEEREVPVP